MSQMMFSYLESRAWLTKQVEKLLSWWWLRGSTPTALHHPLSIAGFLTLSPSTLIALMFLCVSACMSAMICLPQCWASFFKSVSHSIHSNSVQQLELHRHDCLTEATQKNKPTNNTCLDYLLFKTLGEEEIFKSTSSFTCTKYLKIPLRKEMYLRFRNDGNSCWDSS